MKDNRFGVLGIYKKGKDSNNLQKSKPGRNVCANIWNTETRSIYSAQD